jgi:hypothetical protein
MLRPTPGGDIKAAAAFFHSFNSCIFGRSKAAALADKQITVRGELVALASGKTHVERQRLTHRRGAGSA